MWFLASHQTTEFQAPQGPSAFLLQASSAALSCLLSLSYYLWFRTRGGFPDGSDGEESACNAGDVGSVPGWGRSPGEGNGYPLHYSGLENSMDRGNWQAPWGHKESDTTEWLTLFSLPFHCPKLWWISFVMTVLLDGKEEKKGSESQTKD